ncbi:RNA 2'-phosphotransferase [Xanthomonas oryzae]|nr:RNA 2'-phosphotransferase [Xanthomonas oryzae]QBH01560.1 RNA 2'-phosphotransferase [Xanthomonas oryzae]
MSMQYDEISKFLSYVLRHEPQAIGLALDREGWADINALMAGAKIAGKELDFELIRALVAFNDKKRFAISKDGLRIRAVQGHSTDTVTIQHEAQVPPDLLYHGTATRFLDSILAEGLRPCERHHVHLSHEMATARTVGQRYGKPVILEIEALRMYRQCFNFFKADNGVWLTAQVPNEF